MGGYLGPTIHSPRSPAPLGVQKLDHPNICRLHAVYPTVEHLFMVMVRVFIDREAFLGLKPGPSRASGSSSCSSRMPENHFGNNMIQYHSGYGRSTAWCILFKEEFVFCEASAVIPTWMYFTRRE